MKIRDLRARMRGLDIRATVIDKSEPIKKGGKLYSDATLKDETGEIYLNLWRNQVVQIQVGDIITVPNAFVQRRHGILQVSTWSDLIVLSHDKTE